VWTAFTGSRVFQLCPSFPSVTVFDYLRRTVDPVGSDKDLRHFQQSVVDHKVRQLSRQAKKDPQLRDIATAWV